MKKNFAKSLINILFVIVLFITIYSTFDFISYKNKQNEVKEEIKEEMVVLNNAPVYDLNYYKDYYKNNDIVGRIKIEGTNIDTLLVKGTNNTFYLNHSIEKNKDVKGTIFLDYRTNINSKQINIYGHNSNVYDVKFKELESYLNKDFYDNHKYIELWNGINTFTYEIFSVQIITDDYEHMNVNPKDLSLHINKLNKSIYKTDINASLDDNILIIQTCLYKPINSYILINSKKIGEK